MLDQIYAEITKKNISLIDQNPQTNIYMHYPQEISIIRIIGFIECLKNEFKGRAEMQDIAEKLELDYNTLISITGASFLLKFIDINDSMISLSSAGNILLDADDEAKKKIIKEHLVNYVYFIKNIYHILQASPEKTLTKKELLGLMGGHFNDTEVDDILNYTINWARYAELFNYDAEAEIMTLCTNDQQN